MFYYSFPKKRVNRAVSKSNVTSSSSSLASHEPAAHVHHVLSRQLEQHGLVEELVQGHVIGESLFIIFKYFLLNFQVVPFADAS